MKNKFKKLSTTIFGVFCLLLIASCTAVENDNSSIQQSTAVQTLSQKNTNSMALTVSQMVSSYNSIYGTDQTIISNYIDRLNLVGTTNMLFNQYSSNNFILPTINEVNSFLGDNVDNSFLSLNLSVKMKSYIDVILNTENNFESLIPTIEQDLDLTNNEKYSLLFIVTHFYNTYSNGNGGGSGNNGSVVDDFFWTKRNVVAALEGFEKSDANAIFNVALCSVVRN